MVNDMATQQLKSIGIVYTDDCTYSSYEALFVTHNEANIAVKEKLQELYNFTEDQFIELACEGSTITHDQHGYEVQLEVRDIDLVYTLA